MSVWQISLRIVIVVAGFVLLEGQSGFTATPSYSCGKVKKGSVEALICDDEGLAELDRKLAGVYVQSIGRLGEERSLDLRKEQRAWLQERDACVKSPDSRACVHAKYSQRTAELQASYRLVPSSGPVSFFCDDEATSKIYVTYFATVPQAISIEHHGRITLLYLEPSVSGARYVGKNVNFWEENGEALVTWGYDTPEFLCRTRSSKSAQ